MSLILEIKTVINEAAEVINTRLTSDISLLRIIRLKHLLALSHFSHDGRVFTNLIQDVLVP